MDRLIAWFFLLLLGINVQTACASDAAYWRFESAQQSLLDIFAVDDQDWQPVVSSQTLNFGFTDQTVWLKLGPFLYQEDYVLVVTYPLIDDLQLFWVAEGQVIEQHHTGDLQPFESRPMAHRQFVFPFPNHQGELTVFIRAMTEGALQLPYEVTTVKKFFEADQTALTWQALFMGIMLALVIYNSFLFLTTRQVVYFWYILTVAFTALVQINLHGITFQWLWPDYPQFNEKATVLLIALNIITAAVFTVVFLSARKYSKSAAWVLYIVVAMGCLSLVIGLIASYKVGVLVATLVTFIVTVAMWLVAFYLWRKGQILAKYYLIAWTPVIIGHIVMSTSKAGVLPYLRIYDFGPQIGGALEVLLLSFALAYRINLERTRRQDAQRHALILEREAKQNLEVKVAERTKELEVLNAQLRTMTFTDGLTKVANRRRFDEKLMEEWNRGPRHGQPLSLLVMDIDHFKKVNDTYGHLAGDDCLVIVAERCSKQIHRAGDLLARYGGEEFMVLLPCTPAHGALEIAERMRKAVAADPVDVGTGPSIPVTISIGISTMVTDKKIDAEVLIRSADEALYAAKTGGRNQVKIAEEAYLGEYLD